ncbi:UDP-3-O-(3-hydroxymyristoyl)glucosamine N-acyltransferase [Legionella taurinensis]|uniref:UDP-3-O-acylglucosamine N-acyltransferase n=1 Tax=Legionella taurinensis TaxID=70611 RepID=A0A3A5L6I6_9GAMM|nr:UDP-3-O-(3-hydroxymyristoyl)glucosamine N-acyltransferase [Legionella taurinensis]MDX1836096.1 UDP-3-O-(3-hydroxymyristoyl)glucosamine N-acyltransferase [Legionella taurinensis]PUT42129.1 UDP-3-O-(3-hydroxymyristoyl)glucosamine N-acyltransferase [Legionella taurinensis]PUT44916.1 UDP-3-O-(3-hydroxymyristoyl)glucosamine N-acyltransferase [Legionella taurinensis]PUT48238.1 UDP-3-O-(3-hydroxymyristoyl)glucosamine N-acyltransferase [Legionella taurinensis]PUT49051.1 UDP-3-O-(3-hydroxymyristoyl)
MKASLVEIANRVQGTVVGDEQLLVQCISPIDNILAGSLVFADGTDNLKIAEQSDAAAILVNLSVTSDVKPVIQVKNPIKAFIELLNHFYPQPQPAPGIHPTAVIAPDAIIGKNVYIGPYVVIGAQTVIGDECILKGHVHIGEKVTIGAGTTLHPNVTVYDGCHLGQRVCIHAATVIGSDGFGYTFVDGQHLKMPHLGNVVIEDDVEVGANTVIDRATLGSTVIGAGTKIDNLVQVAHSVKLGQHNILCAFTGIAGSTTSGNHVIFAANVGVSDHVRIDDGVILAARAGVPPKKHLLEGNIYLGNPARPRDKAIEQELSVTRIPLMRKNLKALSEKVNELSERLAQYEASE